MVSDGNRFSQSLLPHGAKVLLQFGSSNCDHNGDLFPIIPKMGKYANLPLFA